MKTMPHRQLLPRVVTALLLVVSGLAAIDADAQVRPAYVKNVDEAGRLPYEYQIGFLPSSGCLNEASGATCFNFQHVGNMFLFDGPPVPAGKRLIVQSISALLPTATPTGLLIGLQQFPYSTVVYYLKWSFAGPFFAQTGGSRYGMSATLFATYGPGESPHFILYSPPTGSDLGSVSISGYLIDATN